MTLLCHTPVTSGDNDIAGGLHINRYYLYTASINNKTERTGRIDFQKQGGGPAGRNYRYLSGPDKISIAAGLFDLFAIKPGLQGILPGRPV